jgi:hypothetical protein
MKASRTSGSPNFASASVPSTPTKSAPPLAGSAGRVPRSLTPPSRHDRHAHLSQHIEELRVELKNAFDAGERREIEAELELALAEREIVEAELEGRLSAEPPF